MKGKRVIITGGFGALGAAVASVLRGQGAVVALVDRAPAGAAMEGIAIGNVDLSNPDDAEQAIRSAAASMGGLDGLANIAGAFRWETIEDGAVATWDLLYAVNVKTALCASRAALPLLLASGGAIVNVGAAAATKAAAGMGAYTASKSAVARLTEAMAEEMKGRGVRVNAVLPSIIDTPQNRKDMPDAAFDTWVSPHALGEVIAFLLSHHARAITGALIPVTGLV
jgi:NAD(P)-dependent dehydrogenase (short-subunit alcohol dehydrogenase family)